MKVGRKRMAKSRIEPDVVEDQVFEFEGEGEEEGLVESGIGILDRETMDKVVKYLDEEIGLAEAEREEKVQQWRKWRRQREFRPERKTLDYPWPKSANVTVPMSGMLTQNMYAYIKNTFDVRDPLISVNAINKKSPGDVEVAKTLEKYLDLLAESPFDLNLRPKLDTIVYEGSSMGAIFVKVPWTTDEWIFKSPDEDGEVQTVRSVLHDGPEWVPIAREDFLYREYAQDVHRAPWVAHHFELGEHELHNRGVSQLYQGVEKVKPHARTEPTESEREEQERDGILQQAAAVYDLYEVYLFWKLPNEEYMVDIVVTFHRESKTILRAEFNELGIRCIGPTKYVIRPFYMDGLGIGWILEHMQDEVDYHHRLRINNSHFASMMMFAIRRGSGYGGKEKIYPGKIWKVDDPSKDIVPIRGGEIYPASLQAEAMSLQYAERAVGFSDAQRGFSDLIAKSGTSAQLQMFNAQQGGKLINSITDGMVRSFSEYAMFTVFQLVKNRKKVIQNEQNNGRLTAEEIRELEAALSIPLQDIPRKLRFYVRTTDIDKTFEVRRQNVLTLTQIYGMFWEKVIPLLQIIHSDQVPPQMKPVLWKAFTGSCNMLEKVFRFFGEDETQKFVPDYRRMELLQEIREALLGDLDQAKRVLEDLRRGRGETGIGAGAAAAIGGAAGAREAFGGGFGPQEAVPGGRVGASQPAAQPIAGGAGPLA